MSSLRIKRGDIVKITTGSHKGKTGKIIAVLPTKNAVKVEGIGIVKRHVKPNMLHPQGGIQEVHQPIDISKVALITDTKSGKTSRVGYVLKKNGEKVRVALQAKNKEIDA